jgi:hypothetical protein
MSRLRPLYVPFVQGQDEGTARELLPDGALARLRNARWEKTGRLALRTGWRPVSMATATDENTALGNEDAQDLYSVNGVLVALLRRDTAGAASNPLALASYTNHSASSVWSLRNGVSVCPVTNVRVAGNIPDLAADVRRVSCAVTSDGVFGAVLQQSSSVSVLRIFRVATDETTFYDDLASGSFQRKLVSFGTTFGLIEYTGTVLRLRVIDPQSIVTNPNVTLVTATITDFDAVTAIKDTNTPVGVHVAYVESAAVKYAQFTSAGAQTGSTKTVVAANATRCALASDDTNVHVVYDNASSELQLLTFDASGSFTTSAGPTAVNAGDAVTAGQFAIGCASSIFVASGLSATRTCLVNKLNNAHSTNVRTDHDSSALVSGFVFARNTAAVFVARGRSASSMLNDVALVEAESPWLIPAYSTGTTFAAAGVSAPYAPCQNSSGVVLAAYGRLSDTSNTTAKASATSGATLVTRQAAVLTFSSYADARRPSAVLGGVLHVAGGMLTQFVNGGVVENGMPKPVIFSLTASNGSGTLANGTYSWRAVVVWTDRLGRLHRSAVSDPLSLAVSGSDDTVTVLVHVAKSLRRDSGVAAQPKVELYRTEAGPGELFYLVATASCSATDDEVSLSDTLPDSTIIDNRRLYTEGEFGAVSGALDVAPASASSYVAAARDRLALGGAGPGLQYSQILLPEEPVAFAQAGVSGPAALVYQDSVEGDLTAVATLDDTILAATAEALYVVTATGGPNLAGVGEFPSPARLPSAVGVYDWRSVVENGEGLWFLGDQDKLYALPRGQASPQYVGGAVEDLFAAGTVVGAARDLTDGVLAWAVAGSSEDALVVRDETHGTWSADVLPFEPKALVAHDGRMFAVASDGVVWERSASYGDAASGATAVALVAETGDVQAFGPLGSWGRLAAFEVQGVFRTAAALLLEVSYDQGLNWTSLGTHTVTGLTAGEVFQRQWYPSNQRGGKFRLRVTMTPSSTTAAGCELNGVTMYHTVRSGPTRLPSAKRR